MSTEKHISQEMRTHTMSDIHGDVVASAGNSDGVFIGKEEQHCSFRLLTFPASSTKNAATGFVNEYNQNPRWPSSRNMAASDSACESKPSGTMDPGVTVRAVTPKQLCLSDVFQLPAGPPEKLRRLDPSDLFWQAYHNIGNLMICNCITVLTTHPVVLDHLRAAAEMLLCRHQALRCSINDRNAPEGHHPLGTREGGAPQDEGDFTQGDKSFASRLRTLFTRGADSLCCSCRRRKVYVWKDNRSSARLNVAMARWECSDGGSDRERFGTIYEDEWVKAMAFEQNVAFDTSKGPLWRLRLFQSRHVDEDRNKGFGDFFSTSRVSRQPCEGQGGTGLRRQGSGAPIAASQFCYRTKILGIFHHSVMDGLSRQNFWNELSCCLLLLQNIERYNTYIHELFRSAAGLPSLPHWPVGSHGLRNRSPTPPINENDSRTLPVVSATLSAERAGRTASLPATAPGQMTAVFFDRSKQHSEETNKIRNHRTTRNTTEVSLPCTRLPDALSYAAPLPIPLRMLKIVLLCPRLLAWGYLWERRLLRKVRNPLPVYYPPESFGTQAILGRGKWRLDSGAKRVSTTPKTAKTPVEVPKVHQPFTSVIPILINRDMTTKLLQICKAKEAGLNGLIISTAAVAISQLMWNRRTVLKEIDSMLDGKQIVREGNKRPETPKPQGTTHQHSHVCFPFHPVEVTGRATGAFGAIDGTKRGRDCSRRSHTIQENEEATVPLQLRNTLEAPKESITLPDDTVRERLSPKNQTPIILKPSLATNCEKGNTVDSSGVILKNSITQDTRIPGKPLDTGAMFVQSIAAHRPPRCRRGSEKQAIASSTTDRGKKIWGVWSAIVAGCKQAQYLFEQLQTLMRSPTCKLDPDCLGASNVENHTGPVYLYSFQAVSGRRWFKRTERDEFEPTEFEDQMLFRSFLLEQAEALLTQLVPGDLLGPGLLEEMDASVHEIGRNPVFLSRGKHEENQDTQTSNRRVPLPEFYLPLSSPRRTGIRGGVSLSPKRERQECSVKDGCYGVTACTALPSPQMFQAVIMENNNSARKLPQDCGQSPLVGHHKARPPFTTSVSDMLSEQCLNPGSPMKADGCLENIRQSSEETRVPSDSEVTLSRMSTGQEDNLRQQCETHFGRESCCRAIIEMVTVASEATQELVKPDTDVISQENVSVSEKAAQTLQNTRTTSDKQGTGCQRDTDITRCGIPPNSSFSSCWASLPPGHSAPTQKPHASTSPGSSQMSTNSFGPMVTEGGASSEVPAGKGKRPSIKGSLASSLMKIRNWIGRKSRGEKRLLNPQPDGRNVRQSCPVEKRGNVVYDSQASTATNTATTNVQVTPRAGLGSYALIIPIRLRVSPKCADLKEDLWELASRSAKDVHAIVNGQRPFRSSHSLVSWHSITVYIGSIIDRLPLLRKLGGMKPNYRPSAFLISNGGKWDVTPVDTFVNQLVLEVVHMAKRHRSLTIYRLLHHHQLMEECARLLDRKKQGLTAEVGESVLRNHTSPVPRISGSPNRPSHQRMFANSNSSSPSGARPSLYVGENIGRAVSTSGHTKRPTRLDEMGTNLPYPRLLQVKRLPRTPTSGRYGVPSTKTTATSAHLAKTIPKFHPFSLKIESSWSVVAQHNVGLNYFAHNVVTVDGCLNWTLQYHTNMVSHELAMCYANRIIEILEKVCKTEDLKDNHDVDTKGSHQHMTNLSTTVLPVPHTFIHEAEHPTSIRMSQDGGTMRQRLVIATKESSP